MMAGFHQGTYHSLDMVRKNHILSLPYLKEFELKKCASSKILNHLELNHFAPQNSEVIIFKPQHPFLFVLFTNLPEPWLKKQIESIVEEMKSILADYL